ncbi:ABC transporter substrate-binding protein [Curtobacterium ammoniigenes]|uniref:ABC transporter substrate-binding protein n=1 Tax=Curtobacterium ammoniigenes TaxID=395387 RepID=UPI0009FA99AD|nr:ABC transporter substrate-binding protein [Curtobacterium ammoniigenes]
MIGRVRLVVARAAAVAALCVATGWALSGCAANTAGAAVPAPASVVRLGYFDDVTHAPALVGVREGIIRAALGATALTTEQFNAGPAEIEALNAGAIDAAYVGPSPAINAYVASGGASLRIVAGATEGGAALVVRSGIDRTSQLAGATLATPQLGNTQDVALRAFLTSHGLRTSLTTGGDVTIEPESNALTLAQFEQGTIDGAWVPEPWVTRLVHAGGHVLVDESTQWPRGTYPTTVLVVSQRFLAEHPATVRALVAADVRSVDWLTAHTAAEDARVVGAQMAADGAKSLPAAVLQEALRNVTFSPDPIASAYSTELAHATAAGIGRGGSIRGIVDVSQLDAVLRGAHRSPITVQEALG